MLCEQIMLLKMQKKYTEVAHCNGSIKCKRISRFWFFYSFSVIFSCVKRCWISQFLPRDAMQARPMALCGVRLSITFVNSVITNKHTIPVFPYQTSWWNSNGDPADIGIEGRWGRQKSRFWANIWLHHVLSMLQPARCYQHGATRLWQVVTLIAGSKRRSLLLVGYDDEMFMTRSVDVTPKTT